MQTQKESVLAHLRSGKTITPLEALKEYGCFRLASVIHSLKNKGFLNQDEVIESKLLTKGNKNFSEYSLVVRK